ncbi:MULTISPECIES: hypothetical protein [Rhodobacterales]|uniref:Ferrochelatase n=1 Tax=Halocynthiibacter styelae TaxID=2761955 RepID=A0A8J7IYT2_9RHOB|nr:MULTISPECIES: hypothetical protein [Rhodobacterales]MBI1494770.1 hypothetical protein [Paenihalocynthiibacter styelae]
MNKIFTAAAISAVMATSAAYAGNPVLPADDTIVVVEEDPASSIGSFGSGGTVLALLGVAAVIAIASDSSH